VKNLQSYTGLQAIDAKTAALSPLARKLRMKAGDRIAIVNSPPAYLAQVAPLPGDLHVEVKPDQSFDLVQLFVNNTDELRSLGANAIRGVKADGLLWVCYPKGGKTRGATDLPTTPSWTKRDVLGEFTGETGYNPVAFVKIDDSWTALRFKRG
jgi:hypothetical protein